MGLCKQTARKGWGAELLCDDAAQARPRKARRRGGSAEMLRPSAVP